MIEVKQEQNQTNQLHRQYKKQQFILIIDNLLKQFQLDHSKNPQQLYNQLILQKGIVTGEDIVTILQDIRDKQSIQATLRNQLKFYREQISKLEMQGCQTITKKQFINIFIDNAKTNTNDKNGNNFITHEILIRTEQIQYLSLRKLSKLINKLESNNQNHKNITKQGLPKLPSELINLQKSNIYQFQQQILQQQQQQHNQRNQISISSMVQTLLANYVSKYVVDRLAYQKIQKICNHIRYRSEEIQDANQEKQDIIQKLHQRCQELEDSYYKSEKQYNEDIGTLQNKLHKLQTQSQQKLLTNKQLLQTILSLQSQNNNLIKQQNKLYSTISQSQSQLKWIKQNYTQLQNQYQNYTNKIQQNKKKQQNNKQQENLLFINRSIKEELEDCRDKIQMLRIQRNKLNQKIICMQARYQSQTGEMEGKLREMEEQVRMLKRGNQLSKIWGSRYSQYNNTNSQNNMTNTNPTNNINSVSSANSNVTTSIYNLNNTTKISKINSQNIHINNNQINEDNQSILSMSEYSDQPKISNVQSIYNFKKTKKTSQKQQQPNKITFKKTLSILSSQIQQQNRPNNNSSNNSSNIKVIEQQVQSFMDTQLTNHKLNDNDQIGILQNKQLLKNIEQNEIQVYENLTNQKQQQYKKFISCSATLIHETGNCFPIGIIIANQQVVILDSKYRYKYSFKVEQIKRIYLCFYNWNWIVFKFRDKQYNDKKQLLSDLVVSLRNREEIGRYFYIKFCNKNTTSMQSNISNYSNNNNSSNNNSSISKQQLQIRFQRQDSIWIRNAANNKQTLLSHYTNYYNLQRITLNNTPQIFQANVKQQGILKFSSDVYIIVTKIGIIALEKDSSQLLQNSKNIVMMIPIVQKMNVIQFSHKKYMIKLTYQTQKKAIKIKMRNYAMTRKLRKAIQRQRQENFEIKRVGMVQFGVKSKIHINRLSVK